MSDKNIKDIMDLLEKDITKRVLALILLDKLGYEKISFNKLKVKLNKEQDKTFLIDITLNSDKQYSATIELIINKAEVEISVKGAPTRTQPIKFNEKQPIIMKIDDLYNEITNKTKEELKGASIHVAYEFGMLILSYPFNNYSIRMQEKNINIFAFPFINNMRLESFRIHSRALIDFFTKKGFNDDIFYKDFFYNQDNINLVFSFSNSIENKINPTTAHLSYIRVDQDKFIREPNEEEIKQITKEICDYVKVFYESVNQSFLDDLAKQIIPYWLNQQGIK